ncbi:hypothetical protein L195_g010411 [Trifolium pratense]|uniref:Retrotransposon-related protein n=1 Tax=Trifolium pratense TaxID=57577 RepID=A0A2K3PEU5_TRIPR|nr:hypothetical protein L195_g010411 [Trifolium pratense]
MKENKEEEVRGEMRTLQLSLQSREGLTTNKSFNVWAEKDGRKVMTLIDTRATSNFISAKLVKEVGIELEGAPIYVIEVRTGERVRNRGVCKELNFKILGVAFQQNIFLMELGGIEMVLGIDWLASLGDIEASFKKLILKWENEGNSFSIQGDPALCTMQTSWKVMMKTLQGEGYVIQYQPSMNDETDNTDRNRMGDHN